MHKEFSVSLRTHDEQYLHQRFIVTLAVHTAKVNELLQDDSEPKIITKQVKSRDIIK